MSEKDGWTYRAVKAEILQRIRSGELQPGALLPSEVALSREFGCARATVARALGELSAEGIVTRRRRAGTRVSRSPVRQARFEIPLTRAEVEAAGARYSHALLARTTGPPPDWLRDRLALGPGDEVLHLVCLHFADDAPFQLEDRWISLDAAPEAARVDFQAVGPNEWLVARMAYSNAEFAFFATAADAECARHLGVAMGEPVFVAERTTWLAARAVTHVRMTHPQSYRVIAYH